MRRFLVAGLLTFLVGCAGDWGTVSGTASVDGQPMKKGLVTFRPTGGGADAYANIQSDGTFTAMTGSQAGLKTGEYIIMVVERTIPPPNEPAQLLTPAKYADPATTDLKTIIQPGANKIVLDLRN